MESTSTGLTRPNNDHDKDDEVMSVASDHASSFVHSNAPSCASPSASTDDQSYFLECRARKLVSVVTLLPCCGTN